MTTKRLVLFGIDSDAASRVMIDAMFCRNYEVSLFESVEACLPKLKKVTPDIVLLEVKLSGVSGLDFCFKLKSDPKTAHIPVVFISSDDSLESRLKSYDSGGDDFILKPYSVDVVTRKIEALSTFAERAATLRVQAEDSVQMSSLMKSVMDKYAALVQFMRLLNACHDTEAIGEAILETLSGFGLDGAVQIRVNDKEITLGKQGKNRPLEIGVINHVRDLGAMFEFKRRCVFNFENLTILINDMPIENESACEQLRDNLKIAAEMADAKLRSLITIEHMHKARESLADLPEELRKAAQTFSKRHKIAKHQEGVRTRELLDELIVNFASLGMTTELEEAIQLMVLKKIQALVSMFDSGDKVPNLLSGLAERIDKVLLVNKT